MYDILSFPILCTAEVGPDGQLIDDQSTSIVLAACRADETLPTDPLYPADIFTSCLTTPITIACRWFMIQVLLTIYSNIFDCNVMLTCCFIRIPTRWVRSTWSCQKIYQARRANGKRLAVSCTGYSLRLRTLLHGAFSPRTCFRSCFAKTFS